MNILIAAVPGGGKSYVGTLISVMLDLERYKATANCGQPCPLTGNMHHAGPSLSVIYQPLPSAVSKDSCWDDFAVKDISVSEFDYFWKCMEWFKRGPAFQTHTICAGHTRHIELVDTLHECQDLPEFKCLAIGVDSLTEAHAVAVANHFKQRRRPHAWHIQNTEYAVEYKDKYGKWPASWGEALMPNAFRYLDRYGPIKETKIGNTSITSINYWTFLDKPIETITEFLDMTPTQEQLDLMQSIVQNYNDTQDLHIELMMSMSWQDELDAIKQDLI